MVVITINVSEPDLKFLDALTTTGLFPSRSEAIRHCIRGMTPVFVEQVAQMEESVIATRKKVQEFNKSQDKVILVPNSRYYNEFTKYKILKRLK